MMWKSASQIGVGMAQSYQSKIYVLVCFYLPRMEESEIEDNFLNPVMVPYLEKFPGGAVVTKPIAVYLLTMVVLVKLCWLFLLIKELSIVPTQFAKEIYLKEVAQNKKRVLIVDTNDFCFL